jgi:hypothetical protein
MQPLDVGAFQPYKHWHSIAVQQAINKLEDGYTLDSFLRDLPSIRRKALTEKTIRHSFAKTGIVPFDGGKQVLRKIQKYLPPKNEEDLANLPLNPCTPRSLAREGDFLQRKIAPILSSPTRSKFSYWKSSTETLVTLGTVYPVLPTVFTNWQFSQLLTVSAVQYYYFAVPVFCSFRKGNWQLLL